MNLKVESFLLFTVQNWEVKGGIWWVWFKDQSYDYDPTETLTMASWNLQIYHITTIIMIILQHYETELFCGSDPMFSVSSSIETLVV